MYNWITDTDSAFLQKLLRCQKNSFFVFLLITQLRQDTFTSDFKDNKSIRSHKTVENKVLPIFLLVDGRLRILEAQAPPDPDKEHRV